MPVTHGAIVSKTSVFTSRYKDAEPPFSKTSTLELVFDSLRFRSHKCGRKAKTDEKGCVVFKRKRISVDGGLESLPMLYTLLQYSKMATIFSQC